MIDLEMPAFLKATGPARIPRAPRWKRLTTTISARPEGDRWLEAKRYEFYVDEDVPKLACGLRRVWVVEGRKWCRLADGEQRVKIPMSLWRAVAQRAKEV